MRARSLAALIGGALCAGAQAQVEVDTVLETYFLASDQAKGFAHSLSWGEMNVRFDPRAKATFSFTIFPTREMYDEACLAFDVGTGLVRVGRLRTAFGFSDWSELFYNGFNHRPLVRALNLSDDLRLLRNDAGVEVTAGGPNLQVQAALVDNKISQFQITPDRINAGTLRLQTELGPVLAGVDVLGNFNDDRRIYGLDLRWTTPRVQVRGEGFIGKGGKRNFSGYYLDGSYRVPKMSRTQVVARLEGMDLTRGTFQLYTLGIRQILFDQLALNLNYGWAEGTNPGNLGTRAPERWTLQAMYRVSF